MQRGESRAPYEHASQNDSGRRKSPLRGVRRSTQGLQQEPQEISTDRREQNAAVGSEQNGPSDGESATKPCQALSGGCFANVQAAKCEIKGQGGKEYFDRRG